MQGLYLDHCECKTCIQYVLFNILLEIVGGIDAESCSIAANLDYNYSFPINLAKNGIPFGAKFI